MYESKILQILNMYKMIVTIFRYELTYIPLYKKLFMLIKKFFLSINYSQKRLVNIINVINQGKQLVVTGSSGVRKI